MLHRSQLQIGLDLGFFQRFGPTFQFQQLGSGRFQRPLTTKACAPQRNFMVEGEDRPAETTWFLAQWFLGPTKTSSCLVFREVLITCLLLLVEQCSHFVSSIYVNRNIHIIFVYICKCVCSMYTYSLNAIHVFVRAGTLESLRAMQG